VLLALKWSRHGGAAAAKGSRHDGDDNDGSQRRRRRRDPVGGSMHSSCFLGGPVAVQCKGNEILPSDFRLKGGSPIYRVRYQQRFYVELLLIVHYQQRFLG
jgi:hypothetical protein